MQFRHQKQLKNGILINFNYSEDQRRVQFSLKDGRRYRDICEVVQNASLKKSAPEFVGEPEVNWYSWGSCDPEATLLFSEALKYAAEIAANIEGHPWVKQAARDGEEVERRR